MIWSYIKFTPYVFLNARLKVIDISGREQFVSRDKNQVHRSRTDPLRNNMLSIRTIAEVYKQIRLSFRVAEKV